MMANPNPVLEDPLARRILLGLLSRSEDRSTDEVRETLEAAGTEVTVVEAAALLRRMAESGLVSYRLGAATPAGGFPKTYHSLTTKGRAEAMRQGASA